MSQNLVTLLSLAGCVLWSLVTPGCGGSSSESAREAREPNPSAAQPPANPETAASELSPTTAASPESATPPAPKRKFEPITLGDSATKTVEVRSQTPRQLDDVVKALQPLQIMLGQWQGITQRNFGEFKAIEDVDWVWDFRTDKAQPALTVSSKNGPYIRNGRLTYVVDAGKYRFTTTDKDGVTREYEGTFSAEPRDAPGDDNELQRKYKLELTEVSANKTDETWQIVFNHQDNNRYLLEMSRSSGSGEFRRFDTVGTQRQGTSFALSDTGYKEKTCIISQGLGTIQVSHQGKSYWVCCSGCKAAFEEEPERWIQRMESQAAGQSTK